MIAGPIPCGPDRERHAKVIRQYLDAGLDELCTHRTGADRSGFLPFFNRELRPRLGL